MTAIRCHDRATFLARLRQSNLVSLKEFAALANQLPGSEKASVLARYLIEQGLLTRFQAEMLLAGRTSGFQLGQYRILDELGRGGMGRVFKARHATMHRMVAIKVLSSKLFKTERAQKLFEREVRAAARLLHPNIVTAYDADLVNDRHYLVLEYVDGPNLERLVRQHGPLSVGQACEFIRQAATGLQYASEQGMVHRDIKPANLLVQAAGGELPRACTVKILDFGLARLATPAPGGQQESSIFTENNAVLGTPDYLAPEQAQNIHAADIRSDLYSLGCTLYFLLTGQPPFPGGTLLDKVARHAKEKARPVEQVRPDVPPAVSHLVERLMAKKPKDRFQTPAELVNALEPFAVDGPPPWRKSGDSSGEGPALADFPEDDPAEETVSSDSVLTPERELQLPPPARRRRLPRLRASFPILIAGAAVVGGVAAYILSWFTR